MKRTNLMIVSAVAAGLVLFATGFLLGRHSIETHVYDAPLSSAESELLGRWQISSNVNPKSSTIEFRRDRTAVKRLNEGSRGMVMTWGRMGDELSLQNAHNPGETGDYVPPAILRVVQTDDGQINLVTWDGRIEWNLSRL